LPWYRTCFSMSYCCKDSWGCGSMHYAWLCHRPVGDQRTSKPAKLPHKRSRDPNPFPGLSHTPHCAACEQAAQEPAAPLPPAPPPPIISSRGRPRQVGTSQHFCPNPDCTYQGQVKLGNLGANGHRGGGPWRQLHSTVCDRYFLETHGTPFHGKRVSPDLLVWAVGALAEVLGIRAVAPASSRVSHRAGECAAKCGR
jgi:hypothetical protein